MRAMNSWSLANVLREALLSILSRPLRAVVTLVTLALVLGAVGFVEAQDTTTSIERSQLLRDVGRFVFRAKPIEQTIEPRIDRATCDGLSRLDQIVAAGGLTETQAHNYPAIPGTPLRTFEGTGSVVSVLDPTITGGPNNLWLSTGASQTLGATRTVRMPNDRIGTVGVFEPGLRHPSASFLVIVPTLPDLVGECWFSTRPGTTDATLSAVEVQMSTESLSVVAGSILDDSGVQIDPADEFATRSARYLWIAAGIFGGVFLAALAMTDRGDMALYRLLGASKSQAIAIGFIGSILGIVWSMLFALLATTYAARDMPPEAIRNSLLAISGAGFVMMTASLLGRFLAASGSVNRQLRRRN